MLWSILQHQVWWRGMTTGVLVRARVSSSTIPSLVSSALFVTFHSQIPRCLYFGSDFALQMRAALTCSVYKRALILSNTSRATYSNGRLMNHLSTDISRIDYCAMWFPSIPAAPFQIALCTILLCLQIGECIPTCEAMTKLREVVFSNFTSALPSPVGLRSFGPGWYRILPSHHSRPSMVHAKVH